MTILGYKAGNHPQQVAKNGPRDDIDDRGTDPAYIAELERRFGRFTLDVAAAKHNAKARRFYTRDTDGLAQDWFGRVWCNPPYSDCGAWVRKAWTEWGRSGLSSGIRRAMGDAPELIAMLLPANRCEQPWWQDHVEPYRDRPGSPLRVEFVAKRMRFSRPGVPIGAKGDRPPFGVVLLVWGGEQE